MYCLLNGSNSFLLPFSLPGQNRCKFRLPREPGHQIDTLFSLHEIVLQSRAVTQQSVHRRSCLKAAVESVLA